MKKMSETAIKRAITQSLKMEGISFSRAKKNLTAVKQLKKYGRALSV